MTVLFFTITSRHMDTSQQTHQLFLYRCYGSSFTRFIRSTRWNCSPRKLPCARSRNDHPHPYMTSRLSQSVELGIPALNNGYCAVIKHILCVYHLQSMTSNVSNGAKHLHTARALMSFTGTGNHKPQSWVHSVKQRESRLVGRHKNTVFPQCTALGGLGLAVCSRLLYKI